MHTCIRSIQKILCICMLLITGSKLIRVFVNSMHVCICIRMRMNSQSVCVCVCVTDYLGFIRVRYPWGSVPFTSYFARLSDSTL